MFLFPFIFVFVGLYVEGLIEETVTSTHDAFQILTKGYRNRHVGATAMNRESSRSHAVFSLSIESLRLSSYTTDRPLVAKKFVFSSVSVICSSGSALYNPSITTSLCLLNRLLSSPIAFN